MDKNKELKFLKELLKKAEVMKNKDLIKSIDEKIKKLEDNEIITK